MKLWKLASAATVLVLSSSLNAAIITSDIYNDGSLDWLHLDMTWNMSTGTAVNTFSGDGFRLATASEANSLINDWFGTNYSLGSNFVIRNDLSALVDSFQQEFAVNYSGYGSYGFVGQQLFGTNFNNNVYAGMNYSNTAIGSVMMVRDVSVSTVPVPAAVWLFGSGLIGLAGLARRKKA